MEEIEAILEERGEIYGDAVTTHARIAEVWSGITGHTITALQVALMMAGLKLVRAENGPLHKDNYDDAHGYIKIASDRIMGLNQPTPKLTIVPEMEPDPEEYDPKHAKVRNDVTDLMNLLQEGEPSNYVPRHARKD